MATSNIKLYTASSSNLWELLPHKLFIVDDIEAYLNTKSAKLVTTIQYIKPRLEISITLDLSQTYSEPLSTSYKYLRLENSDNTGKYYYYFVKNVEWRSLSSVRFDLVMDVLNTFKENTHYKFKENTRIIREHKDRFIINDRTLVLTIDDIDGGAGSLGEDDTVILRNMEHDNEYMVTGVITQYDGVTLTIVIQDDLTKAQIEELFTEPTQYLDLISVAKDNANYIEAYFNAFNITVKYFRNIDYINENINPLLQCGNAIGEKIENEKDTLKGNWFLLYRNQNNPSDSLVNPVDCYLIPQDSKNVVASSITGGKITASSLQASYYYYILLTTDTITLDNGTVISTPTGFGGIYVIINKNPDNTLNVISVYGTPNTIPAQDELYIFGEWNCKYVILNDLPMTYRLSASRPQGYLFTIRNTYLNGEEGTFDNEINVENINPVTDLDRTEAKNIKLIKLPYCPYNFTITSSKIDISNDSNWDCVSLDNLMALKLNDLNTNLQTTFTLTTGMNPLINLEMDNFTPSINDLRQGYTYESKLFSSEFYKPTYVYDSFSYVVQLEKLDIDSYIYHNALTIKFDMTKTINSRFMFTFDSLQFKIATESYAKYLPIARNNEEVLYNVSYINYIRNGFNYDVKNKNLSNASNWIGAGLSIAGVAASLALPSAPLKALGIATSLISMAMTTKNAIVSTVQNERELERKQVELRNQTANVAGSDDVDLMSIYAENRLKYLVYEPNAIMKDMVYNLFFYAGYASNRLGLPNHNTRVNFDYLEADISVDKIANIPDDCFEELVNSFRNGVTYIHKTTRASMLSKWDFAQKYENWEKTLL